MSGTTEISLQVETNDASAPLGLEIWVDDHKFFDAEHLQQAESICFEIEDGEGQHELRAVMKNKTQQHTTVDAEGNIMSDARLAISNLSFDKIKLGYTFIEQASYTHDHNGTTGPVVGKFYGEMGCNGVVSLKFTTPIYLWLLEHM